MYETISKHTYRIDVKKLETTPIVETNAGYVELPTTIDKQEITTLFKADEVRLMLKQYSVLYPMIQKQAETIIEFVDSKGEAILTIFPNTNIDFHKGQIHSLNISRSDKYTIFNTLEQRKKQLTGLEGVLRDYQRR